MSKVAFEKLMTLSRRASSAHSEREREELSRQFDGTIQKHFGGKASIGNPNGTWTGFNSFNAAGIYGIDERSAKCISTYFACIRVISNGCAKLPLKFYEQVQVKDRIVNKPFKDSLTYILSTAPNERITYFDFWNTMDSWAIEGGAFAKIDYNRGGDVIGLYPIHPSRIEILKAKGTGKFTFKIYNDDGTTMLVPESEMFHYFGESVDGYIGYSMLQLMQNTLGRASLTDRYAKHFFSNNGRPSGALITDESLSPAARNNIRDSWNEIYAGPNNAGKTAVLDRGIKYQAFGPAFKDLEFTEQWKFNQRQICEFMGVDPRMVGVEENAKGWGTIDADNQGHYYNCLYPWVLRKQQQIRRQLMPRWKYPDTIGCKFDESVMLVGDLKTRSEMAEKKRMNGVWSANDWLVSEGENPSDEPGMDDHLVQAAMVRLQDVGKLAEAQMQSKKQIASPDGNNPSGK